VTTAERYAVRVSSGQPAIGRGTRFTRPRLLPRKGGCNCETERAGHALVAGRGEQHHQAFEGDRAVLRLPRHRPAQAGFFDLSQSGAPLWQRVGQRRDGGVRQGGENKSHLPQQVPPAIMPSARRNRGALRGAGAVV
jgi:hypothetical protein